MLARRITGPIEDISEAARRLGSGDFTARAPVDGCVELADFATTFNNMAARLQTIDNSRGQFMGNIAHELRTPMTTIKGFIDGMLDGTIPQEETKHYLGIVSQETGRLARLVQNMLDITKLEAGEVPIHAQTYDLWKLSPTWCCPTSSALRTANRHTGAGRRPAADLCRPGFCAPGRV